MMTSDLYQHKQVPQDIVIQLTCAWKRGVIYKMTVQESPKSNNLPTLWLRSHSAQGTLAVWDFGSVFTLDTLAAFKRLPILALTTFTHSSNKNMALITSLSSQTPFDENSRWPDRPVTSVWQLVWRDVFQCRQTISSLSVGWPKTWSWTQTPANDTGKSHMDID